MNSRDDVCLTSCLKSREVPFLRAQVSDPEPVCRCFWVNRGQKLLGVRPGRRVCLRPCWHKIVSLQMCRACEMAEHPPPATGGRTPEEYKQG